MSNRYSRHQSVVSREADGHIDEDHWLKQFQKSLEKSAVQSRRVDQSLFEQITGVMNNKSKYTSVSAAVEDMMQRSGLTGYLDNVKFSQTEHTNSKKASDSESEKSETQKDFEKYVKEKDWYNAGKACGRHDADKGSGNVLRHLEKHEEKIPKHEWLSFAAGYSDARLFSDEEKKQCFISVEEKLGVSKKANHHHHSLTKKEDKKLNEAAKEVLPILFKKVPSILKTVENYIKDTKGNLPIPAIIDKVRSIHDKDVSDARDWESDDLMAYVSDLNLKEKAQKAHDRNYTNLGHRDTSIDANDSNTDAFSALMPAKL